MHLPSPLKPHDLVAIISPSGCANAEDILIGEQVLKSWELSIWKGPNANGAYGRFAARDEDRLADLQAALDDPYVKAIFCTRGGYGLSRIIDQINWAGFINHPKWLIGYSDITLLHAKIQSLGYVSLHAPMIAKYGYEEAEASVVLLKYFLFSDRHRSWSFPLTPSDKPAAVSGRLVGGNLSLLAHSIGSEEFDVRRGDILLIEEIAEPLYKVERMMIQLRRAGVFEKTAAILFGYFTNISGVEEMQNSIEATLIGATGRYDLPMYFGLPLGHEFPHYPALLGARMEVMPIQGMGYLKFLA